MSNKKPANAQPNPPKRPVSTSGQPLTNPTGPRGNLVSGDAQAVPPKSTPPKTTPKAEVASGTDAAPNQQSAQRSPAQHPPTPSASTSAQSTLEQAKQAVEQFAAVNAAQAHDLGVQLADAEAAFPLTMMQGYHHRKAELEGSGMDASTFLAGLTEQVNALRETSVTIDQPSHTLACNDGTALLPGTDPTA